MVKHLIRIVLLLAALVEIFGCCCINSLMFQPQCSSYDATTSGYVDVGTNGVKIAAIVYMPKDGRKAIIRCHGNAEDAANTLWAIKYLTKSGYAVASVDYPGYGLSDGEPDEEGCYRNVHRLYDWLVKEKGFLPADIIIDGFSIGTGPAIELAATCPVGGLILEAAYLSAPRIVTKVRILPIDPFLNLTRIKDVKCPITFLHGTEDSIVPYAHGKALYDLAPEPKRFISVEGADHNDLIGVYGIDEYFKLF